MYRLAICEDEENLREELRRLCEEILSELNVSFEISVFSSADELSAETAEGARFDLFCLDIMMQGKNGMELAKELRRHDDGVSILFVTGSSEFLKEGYQVRPIQYLYKPVDRQELKQALRTDLRLHHEPKTVSLKLKNRMVLLSVEDICYVESRNHRIETHLSDGNTRDFPCSLSEIIQRLPQEKFCRCHNSFLVNMAHISEIGRKEIVLDDGTEVPVGRSYSENLRNRFVHYLNR